MYQAYISLLGGVKRRPRSVQGSWQSKEVITEDA